MSHPPPTPPPARPPIRALDDLTVSRIAAGEVVERPASVVKELVENALDAGARTVDVHIEGGGKRRVRVTDDGAGIAREELALAFARHATSKLREVGDLARIATLGFRGEALAAIAAVARVTVVTRRADAPTGTRAALRNGRVVDVAPVGAPVGTTLEVEDLFDAVPARRAFLKGDAAEAGRVTEIVTRYAFAYPDRRFTLTRDGRLAFRSPGTGDLRDALLAAYGHEVAAAMLPLDGTAHGVRVRGFAGPPDVQRANRAGITIFLNGRLIADARLTYALTQAYHGLIPARRYPMAVLLVDIDPERVDVNVHPAKTEVRLRDDGAAFAAVERTVRAAVLGRAPVAPFDAPAGARGRTWRAPARPAPRTAREMAGDYVFGGLPVDAASSAAAGASAAADVPVPAARRALPPLRLLGQLDRAFIVAEGPEGLYLVDQHAAHERVMTERLAARTAPLARQPLLAPRPVALTPDQRGAAETHGEALAAVGYELEPFGDDAVLLRAVPEVLAAADPEGGLRDALDVLSTGGAPVAAAAEARLIAHVCKRASVKAGQALSEPEMRALLDDLERCAVPHTCPHGRPTMIVLSRAALAGRFGRG